MKTQTDTSNTQNLHPNLCGEIHELLTSLPRYSFSKSSKNSTDLSENNLSENNIFENNLSGNNILENNFPENNFPENDSYNLVVSSPLSHFSVFTPVSHKDLPKNGVYILFEKGELGHQTERIVRIGTHTKQDRLASRLLDHFKKEKRNSSIFRKNIGRVFINKDKDSASFLKEWNSKLSHSPNPAKIQAVEKRVTEYMCNAFSFCIISMPTSDEENRTDLEKFLIQTVSSCAECKASDQWFGKNSPIKSVLNSSLWLTIHTKHSLNDQFSLDDIKAYVQQSKLCV